MIDTDGALISYTTRDNLTLKGYFCFKPSNVITVIHVHGSCGNFYENDFIPVMAKLYTKCGINFLSVNNRGHDCIAEAYRQNNLVYIGGCYEDFEESVYDIEGAINFIKPKNTKIVLQGHSLGCLKVLYFINKTRYNADVILLSPSDAYQLQKNYVFPEKVSDQLLRLKRQQSGIFSILPDNEFGIRQNGLNYHIPITGNALISLLESPAIPLLRYDVQSDYFINSNSFIYFGNKDRLWTVNHMTARNFFEGHFSSVKFEYCADGDHHFSGIETVVVESIIAWINDCYVN